MVGGGRRCASWRSESIGSHSSALARSLLPRVGCVRRARLLGTVLGSGTPGRSGRGRCGRHRWTELRRRCRRRCRSGVAGMPRGPDRRGGGRRDCLRSVTKPPLTASPAGRTGTVGSVPRSTATRSRTWNSRFGSASSRCRYRRPLRSWRNTVSPSNRIVRMSPSQENRHVSTAVDGPDDGCADANRSCPRSAANAARSDQSRAPKLSNDCCAARRSSNAPSPFPEPSRASASTIRATAASKGAPMSIQVAMARSQRATAPTGSPCAKATRP